MTGKQHLVSGGAIGAVAISVSAGLLHGRGPDFLCRNVPDVGALLQEHGTFTFFTLPACLLFYMLGTVLPDMDHPSSLIGRQVHVPVGHRRILHSIYPVVLFSVCGLQYFYLWFLGFGYFVHLWMDSLSKCGICWLNPFTGYIRYESGAMIKKGNHLVLYESTAGGWTVCIFLLIFAGCAGISFWEDILWLLKDILTSFR